MLYLPIFQQRVPSQQHGYGVWLPFRDILAEVGDTNECAEPNSLPRTTGKRLLLQNPIGIANPCLLQQ